MTEFEPTYHGEDSTGIAGLDCIFLGRTPTELTDQEALLGNTREKLKRILPLSVQII